MNEHDIGRLEGQMDLVVTSLRDFRSEVGARFDKLESATTTRFNEYGRRIRALEYFRWAIAGIVAFAGFIGWRLK